MLPGWALTTLQNKGRQASVNTAAVGLGTAASGGTGLSLSHCRLSAALPAARAGAECAGRRAGMEGLLLHARPLRPWRGGAAAVAGAGGRRRAGLRPAWRPIAGKRPCMRASRNGVNLTTVGDAAGRCQSPLPPVYAAVYHALLPCAFAQQLLPCCPPCRPCTTRCHALWPAAVAPAAGPAAHEPPADPGPVWAAHPALPQLPAGKWTCHGFEGCWV